MTDADEVKCPHCGKLIHLISRCMTKVNEAWHTKEKEGQP